MNCFTLFQKRLISISYHHSKSKVYLKGRNKSSQEWLIRQMKDPYVEKAKINNYRCRSAFKLLEIDEKYSLLKPGQCVLDCGAAPGSWTQVAISKTNAGGQLSSKPRGIVVAADRGILYPLEGAHMISRTDLSTEEGLNRVKEALDGRQVDVFLSDIAPNASGIKEADHDAIIQIAYTLIRFSVQVSRIGASLLIKIWDGRSSSQLVKDLNKFYSNVKRVKPTSSRNDSAELYILATIFKGLQTS